MYNHYIKHKSRTYLHTQSNMLDDDYGTFSLQPYFLPNNQNTELTF
jgi:hypothetical protein